MSDEIANRVRRIVARQLNMTIDTVDIDADLVVDLGADSLDVMEIVFETEIQLGVDMDSHWNKIVTVGDIVDFVREGKRNEQHKSAPATGDEA